MDSAHRESVIKGSQRNPWINDPEKATSGGEVAGKRKKAGRPEGFSINVKVLITNGLLRREFLRKKDQRWGPSPGWTGLRGEVKNWKKV